ncbi:hypothetical protein IV203_009817 [Nitzschia inconspicua]|uniref:Uncharacterized protein n=1 Tax=Nitzschia inconspicua TaxID=303405 RepID=A0A9K3PJW4_9STRA|nr:hypothetical protein IV203_009817 [Nitzschia inconspicua]
MSTENVGVGQSDSDGSKLSLSSADSGIEGKGSRYRSRSQDTVETVDIGDSSSNGSDNGEDGDDDDGEGNEDCPNDVSVSEHDSDRDAKCSSKSLNSLSSKASSSTTRPVSSNSVSSPQSPKSSSSVAKDENGPTLDEIRRLKEKLQKSLEEEKRLLGVQQQLLIQMEEIEHAIIVAEHEERLARVSSQQAHLMTLLDRAKESEVTQGLQA